MGGVPGAGYGARMVQGVSVTGLAQHEAWQRRVLPPVEELHPGMWSLPVPIPQSPLRYTLSYAYLDGAGVVLVDPGWDSPEGRDALAKGLAAAGATPTDVTGVVVTHVHPDHHGLSGWLQQQGAWVAMHPLEVGALPSRVWRGRGPDEDRAWLRRHGVPEDALDTIAIDVARMRRVFDMVDPDRLLDDGDLLPLPGRQVRAVWTPGHTPGHLCLHDVDAGVLLTGDHLLPRISPNIGVFGDGDDDPLGAYLGSLDAMSRFGALEAFPAHEYRFRGIDTRAVALKAHHHERGEEILRAVNTLPVPTTWSIATALTWSRGWDSLVGMMRRMALAETLAHLRHLSLTGEVSQDPTHLGTWIATPPRP